MDILSEMLDPSGHRVVILRRVWDRKISRDHPEIRAYFDCVISVIQDPDHVEQDPLPGRTRFFGKGVGPSRWLLVVVSYEQVPARVITALAIRKDPRSWRP